MSRFLTLPWILIIDVERGSLNPADALLPAA
jgi:hypothetical protein